jgi:hypothetical protein
MRTEIIKLQIDLYLLHWRQYILETLCKYTPFYKSNLPKEQAIRDFPRKYQYYLYPNRSSDVTPDHNLNVQKFSALVKYQFKERKLHSPCETVKRERTSTLHYPICLMARRLVTSKAQVNSDIVPFTALVMGTNVQRPTSVALLSILTTSGKL